MNKTVIGIVGYGFVGRAIHAGFPKHEVLVNDPTIIDSTPIAAMVARRAVIFISVPTPMRGDEGSVDATAVAYVLAEVNRAANDFGYRPLVVIKSTVPPHTLTGFAAAYQNIRLTMSPEYLRERDAVNAFLNAELLVVGANDERDGYEVVKLFREESACKVCPYFVVDLPSAGVIKYMENTFLAMKVIFMNQWKKVHERTGSNTPWEKVVAAFHADSRCGHSHGQVPGPDGYHGYGGKCLPKDVAGAIHTGRDLGAPLTLMEEVQVINRMVREHRDWMNIKGAVS